MLFDLFAFDFSRLREDVCRRAGEDGTFLLGCYPGQYSE